MPVTYNSAKNTAYFSMQIVVLELLYTVLWYTVLAKGGCFLIQYFFPKQKKLGNNKLSQRGKRKNNHIPCCIQTSLIALCLSYSGQYVSFCYKAWKKSNKYTSYLQMIKFGEGTEGVQCSVFIPRNSRISSVHRNSIGFSICFVLFPWG